MRELGGDPEMPFDGLLGETGGCDLVLVEGYKREPFPKIEIRRDGGASRRTAGRSVPQIVAIASDRPGDEADASSRVSFGRYQRHRRLHRRSFEAQSGMTIKLTDDCFVLDKDRIPHVEALAILQVSRAAGRRHREASMLMRPAATSPSTSCRHEPIPAHDNAAVDGYAFAHSAL